MSPLANAYLEPTALADPETFYPLHVYVCDECLLVQLPVAAQPSEIFDDYAYFGNDSLTREIDSAAEALGTEVLSLPTGQGLIVK